jgi:hypothetical protein
MSKIEIVVKKNGVFFAIDQQGFMLHVDDDEDDSKKEQLKRRTWFAKQLRIALTRLGTTGIDKKKKGRTKK